MKDFEQGRRIRRLRKHLKLSQARLGARLGVTRGAVANWEAGRGLERLHAVALFRLFGVSLNWLLLGIGPPLLIDWNYPEGALWAR